MRNRFGLMLMLRMAGLAVAQDGGQQPSARQQLQ
jgi:hypothetical protein